MKLTKFQNPISGKEGDLTNLGGLWGLVLGGAVIIGTLALSEKMVGAISGKSPISLQPTSPLAPYPNIQASSPSALVL